jgi:hypothetical protein
MSDEPVWYFAFGANMCARVRSARRVTALSREPARLPDYRLTFAERGFPFFEPAFASIEAARGHDVHGVLLQLPETAFALIDSTESPGYQLLDVEVIGRNSGPVRAAAYASRSPVPGLVPSRRYLELLCEGARENGLPADYLHRLEAQPSRYVPGGTFVFTLLARALAALQRRGVAVPARARRRR